jgi:hypothetical protein
MQTHLASDDWHLPLAASVDKFGTATATLRLEQLAPSAR